MVTFLMFSWLVTDMEVIGSAHASILWCRRWPSIPVIVVYIYVCHLWIG